MGVKNEKTGWKRIAARLAKKAAAREANTVCMFWAYQRKQPDTVRKLRKF